MNPSKIRIEQLARAVSRLEEACHAEGPNDIVRDAIVQRFEFCFELAWKAARLRLQEEGIEANTPRATIREAHRIGWLSDPEAWTQMLLMRNLTSHTYDEKMASQVAEFARKKGILMFRELLQALLR